MYGGLPNSVNISTEHTVTFEFQNTTNNFGYKYVYNTWEIFKESNYLKFKFNGAT